jgi:hypothetical protein
VNVLSTGVLAAKTVVAVAAGAYHSLALCSDGTVVSWGENFTGQLGNNNTTSRTTPGAVSTTGILSGKVVVAVAAGSDHSLALCSDGTLVAWGSNNVGQLGNNILPRSLAPAAVSASGALAGRSVVGIAAGGAHNLVLCSDGRLASWGSNNSGQLGNNGIANSSVPVAVSSGGVLSGKSVVAVSAGSFHSVALSSDGTVATWGENFSGQLGDDSVISRRAPVAVNTGGILSGRVVSAVSAGRDHTLALCSDSTLVAWGSGMSLGNNSSAQSRTPVAVSTNPVASGERYAMGISGSVAGHSLGLIASPPAPVATTLPVTNLASGSVTLNGKVNGAGGSAAVVFEYGVEDSYGSTISGTPTPVMGSTDTAVSASLLNLAPNTTFHYRVRATSAGGTSVGADQTFITPPDITVPYGGMVTLNPSSPVDASSPLTVNFSNWTDHSLPLTYSILIDGTVVSPEGPSQIRSITAPPTVGVHTLKGQIRDSLGNLTEVTQNLTVIVTQEDWRTYHFGTAENLGSASDSADPDGDGQNNLFEYVAGLSPMSSLSHFEVRVESVSGQPTHRAIVLRPVVAGRIYTVQYKTNLSDPEWVPLIDMTTSDAGAERTVTDLSGVNGPRFYRVEITRP